MYLFLKFSMSQVFLVVQYLNPFGKLCPWALMIAINMSVAIFTFDLLQGHTDTVNYLGNLRLKHN